MVLIISVSYIPIKGTTIFRNEVSNKVEDMKKKLFKLEKSWIRYKKHVNDQLESLSDTGQLQTQKTLQNLTL